MKFKNKYSWAGDPKLLTLAEVIETEVDSRMDYYAGTVETLTQQMHNITNILGIIASELPLAAQAKIAEELGYMEVPGEYSGTTD